MAQIISLPKIEVKKRRRPASIYTSLVQQQSGRLIRQHADFPQRGKSAYSSARSPYLPVIKLAFMPARLRMASPSACLTVVYTVTALGVIPYSEI